MIGPRRATVSEPIVGFRRWRITPEGLRSTFVRADWPEPVAHASCKRYYGWTFLDDLRKRIPHRAPGRHCRCGLYANHAPVTSSSVIWDVNSAEVGGCVVAWGRIQVHATGFRAEHMRILALADVLPSQRDHDGRRLLVETAQHLGVPLVEHDALAQVAAEYGRPAPLELRGAA